MIIQVLKNETYKDESSLPKSATERSTGKDIVATSDPEIVGVKNKIWEDYYYDSIDYIQYRTNLFVSVQIDTSFGARSTFDDYDVLGFPRSSVSKYNLILANSICLIDADYRGEVLLRFKYIWQPIDMFSHANGVIGKPDLDKIYKKGDKICQLKITKSEKVNFKLTDVLDDTSRGSGGFGSTDTSIKIPTHITDLYQSTPTLTPKTKYSDLVKEREIKI